MKLNPNTAGSRFNLASLVAIGNAGTGLALSDAPEGVSTDGTPFTATFRSFKACGFEATEVGALHGRGEACGLPEWDCALFVSHRGTPVRLMPLGSAIKAGLVSAHKVLLRGLGPEREVTVYAPEKWTPAQRQPKFLACCEVPAGRIESRLVQPDKRNASYAAHVLPLAMRKATPAPAVKPAPAKPAPAAKGKK